MPTLPSLPTGVDYSYLPEIVNTVIYFLSLFATMTYEYRQLSPDANHALFALLFGGNA
jgi:hypothetical protein